MWLITRAGEEGDGIDLIIAQMSGRPVDFGALSQLRDIAFARNAPPPRTLVDEVEAAEGGWTSLLSIDIWGAGAAELMPDGLLMDSDGVLASSASADVIHQASTVAWHEHTAAFALLECGSDYAVHLEPDPSDQERDIRILSRWAPQWESQWAAGWQPDGPDYRVLDWHLYLGDATTTIHGQTRFVRIRGRLRAILELRHLPAGRVWLLRREGAQSVWPGRRRPHAGPRMGPPCRGGRAQTAAYRASLSAIGRGP